jgi:hypothetical protein
MDGRMDMDIYVYIYRYKGRKRRGGRERGCFSFPFLNRIRVVTTIFLTLASYKFHGIIAWVRTDRQYNFIRGLLQSCDNA